jgi:hypothetical protein
VDIYFFRLANSEGDRLREEHARPRIVEFRAVSQYLYGDFDATCENEKKWAT